MNKLHLTKSLIETNRAESRKVRITNTNFFTAEITVRQTLFIKAFTNASHIGDLARAIHLSKQVLKSSGYDLGG